MSIEQTLTGLRIGYLDLRMEIMPWGDDALRVRATRNPALPPEGEVLLPVPSGQETRIDFPGDAACWDCEDQYMFGPEFLVAPIAEAGSLSRAVYLPRGSTWKSVWDQSRTYQGGQSVEIVEPFGRPPVLVPRDSTWALVIDNP